MRTSTSTPSQPGHLLRVGQSLANAWRQSQRGLLARLRQRLPRLNTRWLLCVGLSSIVVSILLVAQFIGLLPDPNTSALRARTTVAAAVGAASSGRSFDEGDNSMQVLFDLLIERHSDLRSAVVRRQDGTTALHAGAPALTTSMERDDQTVDLMILPISFDGQRWGRIELHFAKLSGEGWQGVVANPMVQLATFMVMSCLFSFNLYLRRMLRHLDPSRAVPERVQKAFDTLSEAVLLCDVNGFILLANRSFANLTGIEPAALLGRQVSDFAWLTRDARPIESEKSPWRMALSKGQPVHHAYLALIDSNNQRHSFHVNCSPTQSADGSLGGVLMSLEDITSLEAIQAALRVSQRQADEANLAKSEFLANMSHEIRTPMNAILGFANVLRRGQSQDPPRHLETIHRNARNLLDLINDILDLSKVESGRLEIEQTDCTPHRLLQEIIEVLGVRADEKGVTLHFEADGPVPAQVQTDATRLRQIVTNLLGNAIKFTEQGPVQVTERWRVNQGKAWLEIAIQDSGIGIPDDKIHAIFEPFVQAEGSTTRRFGGTGLGLSISRKFARAMGGDITVTSELGRGSTFLISIPVDVRAGADIALIDPEQAIAEAGHVEITEQRNWAFAPARVLVVDDSPENRELVKLVLNDVGLAIFEAENGQIAVDKMLANTYDIVLMDVHMPVMDGFTAVSLLRKHRVRTPIIAFTADAIKGFETRIRDAGFSGYLTKPIDIDAMLGLLREHLSIVPLTEKPAVQRRATPSKAAGQIAQALESRLASHPKIGPIVTQFAIGLPARLVAMRAAADHGDWHSVAELAHWLKGSAGSVGFDAFTQPAKELENAARDGETAAALAALADVLALGARVAAPTTAPLSYDAAKPSASAAMQQNTMDQV